MSIKYPMRLALPAAALAVAHALPFQIARETLVAISQEISYVDSEGDVVVVSANPGIENENELIHAYRGRG